MFCSKLRVCFFISFFLSIGSIYGAALDVSVAAQSAILINFDNGAVLFEKNPHQHHYPASITKIATAAFVLDVAEPLLDAPFVAEKESIASITAKAKKLANYSQPAYWLEPDGTHIGLKQGEILPLRDLLFGLLISSGNDAANVIAQGISGSVPQFMDQLNAYLKKLGCLETTFCNPHGLFHPEHRTTAYDMAILTAHALKNPLFRAIVATTKFVRPKTNKQAAFTLSQGNRLLKPGRFFYPHALGVKTGYIAMAQHTLVAAATKQGRTLIAVLLKCKDRASIFEDAIKLFEAAFNQQMMERIVLKAGPQGYFLQLEGAAAPIQTHISEEIAVEFYPAEEPSLTAEIEWLTLSLPVLQNQHVGNVLIYADGNTIVRRVPLLAQAFVSSTWYHWLFGRLF